MCFRETNIYMYLLELGYVKRFITWLSQTFYNRSVRYIPPPTSNFLNETVPPC